MRAFLSASVSGIVCAAAFTAAVAAAPVLPRDYPLAPSPKLVLVGSRCGYGWHYVPAGYARHGKWRDAHCSRN